MAVTIHVGDALEVLRGLPSESVQCVVTSPPYFALRAYNTEPKVWDGDPEHAHEWQNASRRVALPPQSENSTLSRHGPDGRSPALAEVAKMDGVHETGICPCGAWRGELGLEPTPALFIEHLVAVFEEVKRVLRKDGLCFVNLGDSYAGSGKGTSGPNALIKHTERQGFVGAGSEARNGTATIHKTGQTFAGIPAKSLMLIPERFAIAMQDAGWIVRSRICWAKKAPMPESTKDRPTSAWEHIYMFSKSRTYFYDAEAVRQPHSENTHSLREKAPFEPKGPGWETWGLGGSQTLRGTGRGTYLNPAGANLRNFWLLSPEPSREQHYAAFPTEIPRRCILAGTSQAGACPACGSPWVRVVERIGLRDLRVRDAAGEAPKHDARIAMGLRSAKTGLGGSNSHNASSPQSPEVRTTGWSPSCSCVDAGPPVPQTVLDPFLGSGTTALVADRLGRHAIGIELSPTYAEMARRRIEGDERLFSEPVVVEQAEQLSLLEAL